VAGPPNYISPEQANGDAVDSRNDLFSPDEPAQTQAGNQESTESKESIDDLFGSGEPTPFKMLVGGGAFDSGVAPPRFEDITDGSSYTIALMAFEAEVIWTKPEDLNYGSIMFDDLPARAASFLIGMADGSVREGPSIHPAMITRAGGEVIESEPNR
jgi:hypothetical protein